jgi:uncharacterized protein YdaU (DUF1376 family)
MAGDTKVDIWMPLYVSDFLTATLGWSAEERGHYLTLLMAQWALGDQGLPSDVKALDRISQGLASCWQMLESKFPAGPDGRLRNARLEEHRADSIEAREKKVRAANAANDAKRLKAEAAAAAAAEAEAASQSTQTDTQCDTHTETQTATQCGTPSPSPSQENTGRQFARAAADPPLAKPKAAEREPAAADGEPPGGQRARPGWVHDEWARIVAAWNATERAVPWTLATPPNGFADQAASPGWVESALTAIALLPQCRRFERPVPWTQFVREIDRILAGEFRDPREERRELAAAGGRQQRRGNMR